MIAKRQNRRRIGEVGKRFAQVSDATLAPEPFGIGRSQLPLHADEACIRHRQQRL